MSEKRRHTRRGVLVSFAVIMFLASARPPSSDGWTTYFGRAGMGVSAGHLSPDHPRQVPLWAAGSSLLVNATLTSVNH